MRIGVSTICVVALLCGACAARVVQTPQTENLVPVVRQPAGYYPGDSLSTVGVVRTADFTAWLVDHRVVIDDIQNRIVEIRKGRRAPGCIGEDRYTCVASLAQKFAIADN